MIILMNMKLKLLFMIICIYINVIICESSLLYDIYEKYHKESMYSNKLIYKVHGYEALSTVTSLSYVFEKYNDQYDNNNNSNNDQVNNIDDIIYYVINLDKRVDRLQHFLKEWYSTKLPSKHLYRISGVEHYYGPIGCVLSHLVTFFDFTENHNANHIVVFEDDIKFFDHSFRFGEHYNRHLIYDTLHKDNNWEFILLTPSNYLKINGSNLETYLNYNEKTNEYKKIENNNVLLQLRPDHSTTSAGYITKRSYIDSLEANMLNSYFIMFRYIEHMPIKYLDEAALDRQWIELANKPDARWYILKTPIASANTDFESDINKFVSVSNISEVAVSNGELSSNEVILHIPVTIKGLGRHLFIVWAAIGFARKHNVQYTFWDMKRKPWKSYWNNFFSNISFYHNPWPSSFYYAYRDPNDFEYKPIPSFDNSFTINGYFQSYKYFDDIYDDIYSTLITNANKAYLNEANNVMKTIKSYTGQRKCIFVHINQKVKIMETIKSKNLSKYYYSQAIKHFDKNNFFVFLTNPHQESDNNFIKEVENEIKQYTGNYIFIQNHKYENYVIMLAMIQMDGAIIANSAYSWWIAYLMDNHRNKTVVLPSIWYENDFVQIDKKLDHWLFV